MPKLRADAIEYKRRLMSIQMWIIERNSTTIITKQILDNKWCTSERHAKRLIAAARAVWFEEEVEDINQKRQIKIRQLEHTIKSLKEQFKGTPEGIRAIIAVEKEIMKLEGTAVPVKIDVSRDNDKPAYKDITYQVVFKDYSEARAK